MLLLSIWFPQIVIVIGGFGVIYSFIKVFEPSNKKEDEHSKEHPHH